MCSSIFGGGTQDKETGEVSKVKTSVVKDECNKADTTLEGLAKLPAIMAMDKKGGTPGPLLERSPPTPTAAAVSALSWSLDLS